MRVDEHTIELASVPAFYRTAPAPGVPPVYLHGLPTSCDDWTAMLERTGGLAPDLLGFGRAGKGGHLDFTIAGLATFVERLLDELAIARARLAGHDWGALVALELAARAPARYERLALISPPPLADGHQWSRLERVWHTPALGELAMGMVTRRSLARRLRAGTANAEIWSPARVAETWRQFDQGTQRAILLLHRATPPDHLSRQHERTTGLGIPTLLLRGERDPWLTDAQAHAVDTALPAHTTHSVQGAGHWPWLERPEGAETLAAFLDGGPQP